MRHTECFEVVGQRQEVPGHRPEGADLGEEFPGVEAATRTPTLMNF
jgi:hypothetical protein